MRQGSYADPTPDVRDRTAYGWDHSLGEIVTALVEAPDGTWHLPAGTPGELPLSFLLPATTPA